MNTMFNNTNVHSEEQHLMKLNNLCRICGGRSFRRNVPGKLCQDYKQSIRQFFGISVSNETNGVLYSNSFCSKCYHKLAALRKKNMPVTVTDTENIWMQFDSSLTVSSCTVCKKYDDQCTGGRPKKKDRSHSFVHNISSEANTSFNPTSSSTPKKMLTSHPVSLDKQAGKK